MLWFAVEVFLNLILLTLVGLFLKLSQNRDALFFAIFGVGFFSSALLVKLIWTFSRGNNRQLKNNDMVKRTSVNTPKAIDNSVKASLAYFDFVESEVSPTELNLSPFQFAGKKPVKKGQSQLKALDELVVSLPQGFRRCLVVSDLKLNVNDRSLLELLAEGSSVEALFCNGIYDRIDLLPNLGNVKGASLFTQKCFMQLASGWINKYDLIICHIDEESLTEVKGLAHQTLRWHQKNDQAGKPAFSFQSSLRS